MLFYNYRLVFVIYTPPEFWTMIEFIRPGFFSSLKDFSTRFIVPIQNGQYVDSTSSDVRYVFA